MKNAEIDYKDLLEIDSDCLLSSSLLKVTNKLWMNEGFVKVWNSVDKDVKSLFYSLSAELNIIFSTKLAEKTSGLIS